MTPTVIIEILIEKLTGVRFQHNLSRGIQILLLMETAFLPEEQHELSVCTRVIHTEVDPEVLGWGGGGWE